ncbi:MAG: phosphofructokinase [Deltaproteobacteria bacterium]|nr:MAG: phosphofructokinase [Deltaproteobacteria bacterium]
MAEANPADLEPLMQNPQVARLLSNVNPDTADRLNYRPPVCDAFTYPCTRLETAGNYVFDIDLETRKQLPDIIDNTVQVIAGSGESDTALRETFQRPRRIGVVFSGGPAPGGHNVIAGIYDAAQKANPDNQVIGFVLGPDGIIEKEVVSIDQAMVDAHRNLGGFSMIKTGRTKIDTPEKMSQARETCLKLGLDAVVIIGGDDSNTNAAFMAQALAGDGIQVIGVPKTIDGDLQVRTAGGEILCAMSFGFHTAARAFSQNISNLCNDAYSDVKYWHICKVMGRVASHLALEVALQTHANLTFIGEDLADYVDDARIEKANAANTVDYTAYGMTLRHLSRVICDAIVRRAAVGKNYGVIVVPEGILEFINEIQIFIIKLNTIIADYNNSHDTCFHDDFPQLDDKLDYLRRLGRRSREGETIAIWNTRDDDLFNDMPAFFQEGLLLERDSHGNFQFSKVETDKILMEMVKDYLRILRENGTYKVGIQRAYYEKILRKAGLDPDYYGDALFANYADGDFLRVHEGIISRKTLVQAFQRAGILKEDEPLPESVIQIFKKSVPDFKIQTHFYGYDGRGADPTKFDCNYTYNLGLTVFSLIAGGATGQMAAIRNLDRDFSEWEPLGIPIAPLMHLEERKGKMALVIEKSVVDLNARAFKIVKRLREQWLAAVPGDDPFRRPGPIRFAGETEEDRPITLQLNRL